MSSSFPVRISVMTCNSWGNYYWPERKEAFAKMIQVINPDVILLQEVTLDIINTIISVLPSFTYVQGKDEIGWATESNIMWNSSLFTLHQSGLFNLDLPDLPNRGLFWAYLSINACVTNHNPIFFSTMHLPWTGNSYEVSTGINPRIIATKKVCDFLKSTIVDNSTAIILTGDFNEDFHPLRILKDQISMTDVFEALDCSPPITHPVRPSDPFEELRPNRTLDWITFKLPVDCRVISAFAKTIRGGSGIPPSDHLPIVAIFEIK